MTELPHNTFKAALARGQRQIGMWSALASPYTAEICAGADFDWLLLDAEHGPSDVPRILAQLQAVAAYRTHPVVRLPSGDTALIKQYLDIGATTLLVPMVESAAEAERLVRAVRYPPEGTRGVGSALARASRWNRVPSYLRRSAEEICLLVQVESRRALAEVPAIAGVDGVDGVFIGPSDLAASLGHLAVPEHPEVQGAIDLALATLVAAGKPAGVLAFDPAAALRYLERGMSFVAVGSDVTLLVRALDTLRASFLSPE